MLFWVTGSIMQLKSDVSEDVQQLWVFGMAEAIKSSEIEGEYPSRKDVLSSIRKNLGLHYSAELIKDNQLQV